MSLAHRSRRVNSREGLPRGDRPTRLNRQGFSGNMRGGSQAIGSDSYDYQTGTNGQSAKKQRRNEQFLPLHESIKDVENLMDS